MRVIPWTRFLLCLCATTTGVFAADNPGVLHADFGGQVTVGSDGRVDVGEITGVSSALEQVVRSHLAAIHFVPATPWRRLCRDHGSGERDLVADTDRRRPI